MIRHALGLVAVALCMAAPSPAAPESRVVRDIMGREVSIPAEVRRLVAIGPGALRLVVYLGATDRVAGIEDTERRMVRDPWVRPYASTLDERFFDLPVVAPGGPGKLPDFERVMMVRPDILVAVGIDAAQVDNVQAKTGVPVVCLSYGALGEWREEAQQSLTLLGNLLGRQEQAKRINAYVEALQKELKTRTVSVDRNNAPSVYFGGISFKGAHGLTSTQSRYSPGEMVAAHAPVDGLERTGHLFVDEEQILVWDPDVIFVDMGSRAILARDFEKRRGFYRLLGAVKAGRVYSLLPYNYYNTNMELALLNACFVGKTLYPEPFADLDLSAKAAEIFAVFLGRKIDDEPPAYRRLAFPENGPIPWGAP